MILNSGDKGIERLIGKVIISINVASISDLSGSGINSPMLVLEATLSILHPAIELARFQGSILEQF